MLLVLLIKLDKLDNVDFYPDVAIIVTQFDYVIYYYIMSSTAWEV